MEKKKLWIQGAVKKGKEGSLHRQLEVPLDRKIPKTLLARIKTAEIGTKIKNPAKTGKPKMKVTRLLKKRAVLAHTLRELKWGEKYEEKEQEKLCRQIR